MCIVTFHVDSYREVCDEIDKIKEGLEDDEVLADIDINPIVRETQSIEYSDKTVTIYKYSYICTLYIDKQEI